MVNEISIKNFKSIRDLKLTCKKLNVFIGEPNSGKSNIIEALSLLSQNVLSKEFLKQVVRFKDIGGLFYDFNYTRPIEIVTGIIDASLKYDMPNGVNYNQFKFTIAGADGGAILNHEGEIIGNSLTPDTPFRLYEYQRLSSFEQHYIPHLAPPFGKNLPTLLLGNSELKRWVSDFFKSKGLKMTIKPMSNEIEIGKIDDDVEYSFPYISVSDTLQRIVFYTMAMHSNTDKVLLFDEPDTHTFPFNTKMLGERIALDETNQYFITTHSPYLLLSMIEKSSFDNINVCVTSLKNGETVVMPLAPEQIAKALDHYSSDIFLNLDNIID